MLEAEKHDPGSVHTQYLLYKLALMESNVEEGKPVIHTVSLFVYTFILTFPPFLNVILSA